MKTAIIRALKTFAQAALGYICVNLVYIVQNPDCSFGEASGAAAGIAISAIAAGLAAVMNLPIGRKKDDTGDTTGSSGSITDGKTDDGSEK